MCEGFDTETTEDTFSVEVVDVLGIFHAPNQADAGSDKEDVDQS